MPRFEVTAPDGARYEITAPDEATAIEAYNIQFGAQTDQAPQAPKPDRSKAADVAQTVTGGMLEGIPIVGPYIRAGIEKAAAATAPFIFGGKQEDYERFVEADKKRMKSEMPVTDIASQVGGAVLAGVPLMGTTAGGLLTGDVALPVLGRYGTAAATNAAIGAADAAARGNDPAIGGAIGGAAGLVGAKLSSMAGNAAKNAETASARVAAADEFGVPLTRGQATGDVGRVGFEEAARAGGKGDFAQRALTAADEARTAAMRQAEARIGSRLGGDIATTADDAARVAQEGIEGAASKAKAGVDAAYDAFRDLGGAVDRNAVEMVPAAIRDALAKGAKGPVLVDESITPTAAVAMRKLDEMAAKVSAIAPGSTASVKINALENMRRMIIGLSPKDATDGRALNAIKRAYDDWLEGAVQTALMSGDEKVITALKEARGLSSAYKNTFFSRGAGDDAGKFIQRVINASDDAPVTSQEVANALWGSAKVGAQGKAVRIAERLKTALGTDSEAWSAIRQGTWQRIVEPTAGQEGRTPLMIAKRIDEFVSGDGASLAKALFTADEIALMKRYSGVAKMMVPPSGATNPSRSGFKMMPALQNVTNSIAAMLGGSAGGSMLGGAAGGPVGAIVGGGASAAAFNITNALKTKAALKAIPSATGTSANVASFLARAGQSQATRAVEASPLRVLIGARANEEERR